MTRRPGVTLLEVLVAIFVMGIGLLALLTLFPAAALQMAQAIKDDRTGHIKQTAFAQMELRFTDNINPPAQFTIATDPVVVDGMLNPGGGLGSYYITPGVVNPAYADIPSYPVFVDPIGWNSYQFNTQGWRDWLCGTQGLIARRTVHFLHPNQMPVPPEPRDPQFTNANPQYKLQQLYRWFTLMDDMTFPRDVPNLGQPCPPTPPPTGTLGGVERAIRYSWAFQLRRPKAGRDEVDITMVVYQGREMDVVTGNLNPHGEWVFPRTQNHPQPVFHLNRNVVELGWLPGEDPPEVEAGGWILDATPPQMVGRDEPHGYFYRVVNVTQTSATTMDVEVQTPFRGFQTATTPMPTGRVIILKNVVEVFEKLAS